MTSSDISKKSIIGQWKNLKGEYYIFGDDSLLTITKIIKSPEGNRPKIINYKWQLNGKNRIIKISSVKQGEDYKILSHISKALKLKGMKTNTILNLKKISDKVYDNE